MKLKVAEDVDAPLGFVYVRMADFTRLEEEIRGRGAELKRDGNWTQAAAGCGWKGNVTVRGKPRRIDASIGHMAENDTILVESKVGGMDCTYEMTFYEMAPEITRVSTVLELKPNTLSARLVIQTLKLARGRVLQKMTGSLVRRGNEIEAEYRAQSS